MKSIFATFWFWLLMLGLLLILIGALIGGGTKCMNGWVWALFIVGIIFFVLSFLFMLFDLKYCPSQPKKQECSMKQECGIKQECEIKNTCGMISDNKITLNSPGYLSSPPIEKYNTKPISYSPGVTPNISCGMSPVTTCNTSFSPMGSPTKICYNIPQAQRGFVTTSQDLSSLAPC